ncbi:hypothetical protein [Candidatus Nitrososphaera gargensis]|nr:hypothetical protein [Candidatus Nitrososphaera gargensis]
MTSDAISDYFVKAKAQLKAERDSMAQEIKESIAASKRKAMSKA